ncbi:MAG: hypothetical protein DRI90_09175 [Deltaproteobacteria bacterium]|nr:MAG: hypothetical protein DRI90_09175 [Deltaproteobacteria bacterium]
MTAPPEGPEQQPTAARGASVARDVLERALAELVELPPGSARDQLLAGFDEARTALDRLADASPRDPHYLDRFDAACGALQSLADQTEQLHHPGTERFARRVAGAAAALQRRREHVLDEMVAVQETAELRDDPAAPEGPPEPFRVSTELPALRQLPTMNLRHLLPAGSSADPADGPASPPARRPGRGQLDDLARDCLAEIGRMGRLCHLDEDRLWSSVITRFEQRLLANLDALIALGRADLVPTGPLPEPDEVSRASEEQPGGEPATEKLATDEPATENGASPEPVELASTVDVIAALAGYTGESPADADRAFVRSLVLGSLAGEQPVRAAMMSIQRAHRSTLPAHRRALSLAPNPAITTEMKTLSLDDEPRLVALALDVLDARGQPTLAQATTLIAHPHVVVRCSAAAALAHCHERAVAAELVASQLDAELDDRALVALAEALLRLDDRRGLTSVRARLSEEQELPGAMARRARFQCLTLLALAGDGSDVPALLSLAEQPRELELLGWHGDPAAVEPLLEVLAEPAPPTLHSGGESRPLAAARALERITGATGHDQAPRGLGFRTDAVDRSLPRWRDWWSENQEQFSADTKYRNGEPFTISASLAELQRDGVPQDVRQHALLELALLSGGVPVPRLDDWSARFVTALGDLARHFRQFDGVTTGRLHGAGEWPTRRLGERHRTVERLARST